MTASDLYPRFAAAFGAACGRAPTVAEWEAVAGPYAGADRHYHALSHLRAMFEGADRLFEPLSPDLVLAIFLHDVVYDPTRKDNEARSAECARTLLADADDAFVAAVERHVLATATHESDDPDTWILLDLDLSILGAEPAAFDAYDEAIRREYAFVPEAAYQAGRAAVLNRFLQRDRLYFTDVAHAALDGPARRNLRRRVTQVNPSG